MRIFVSLLFCCSFSAATTVAAAPTSRQDAKPGAGAAEEVELEEDADYAPPEGHSHIGDSFNEGPRQAAYLMPDWDKIQFPVSTEAEQAQRFFAQGIGQLHGFWYLESERSFRQAAAIDPECAMTYWGMGMANVENEERAAAFAHEAYKRRAAASDREQRFIDSLAEYYDVDHVYADEIEVKKASEESETEDVEAEEAEAEEAETDEAEALERELFDVEQRQPADDKKRMATFIKDLEELLYEYPDDIEAKAILVNQLWMARRKGIPTPSRLANEALLEQIFAVNPMHPAHHYRIHLWDSKDASVRAVSSAARSGQAYPSIAHMWHMGGHIFARLGRHSDAAWQQEASARTDHAYMMRDMVMPDQIHNFAHNNEWLTRSLRNAGRISEAIDLAKNMIELPRHPVYNHLDKRGCSSTYGRRRLAEALELYERWEELIATSNTIYLEPIDEDDSRVERASLLAQAYLFSGDEVEARAQMAVLDELLTKAKTERMKSVDEAEEQAIEDEKKPSEVHDAMSNALTGHSRPLERLRSRVDVVRALETLILPQSEQERPETLEEGDDESAEELPDPEAIRLAALKTLEDSRFSRTHLSRLLIEAGEHERAAEMAREAIEDKPGVAILHANLAYVLWATGDEDGAHEAFETLRGFSERFELDNPPFERLAPLVKELGLPNDWRQPMARLADIGERVPLAGLGPFRWSPTEAPDWKLPDGFGNEVSLADYKGKPVLMIFFLGFGCVHCVEQLGAFAPVAQEFLDAGIPIVTIGTDSVEDLADSQERDTAKDKLPFPILADPKLEIFKQYRCHDDFESLALHGTFLLDGEGRVRWQDISYEPFMDTEFLLTESKRLLALPIQKGTGGETARASVSGASASR